jgi:hypothetical protein
VAQSIECRGGEESIGWKGLVPLGEVEIAGDDGRALLVTRGDQIVQVLIGGGSQGFEFEVIDDDQRNKPSCSKFAYTNLTLTHRPSRDGRGRPAR